MIRTSAGGALLVLAACGAVPRDAKDEPRADAAVDAPTTDAAIDALPAPTIVRFANGEVKTEARGMILAMDTEFRDDCRGDEALIGVEGADGPHGMSTVVGKLRGRCGLGGLAAIDDRTWRIGHRPGSVLAERGKGGGAAWTRTCPDNEFVVGFEVRAGHRLDRLVVRCASIAVVAGPDGWQRVRGAVTSLEKVGGDGGAGFDAVDCPGVGVVAGLFGSSEASIGSLGLVCVQPSVQ